MRRVLISIGIERYSDERIPAAPFAEADATDFAVALKPLGFDAAHQIVLSGEKATKTAIESAIRRTLKSLGADDHFHLFMSGRGFSIDEGNYLASRDTDLDDLEATSISVDGLLDQIERSPCKHVVLWLDSGEGSVGERWSHAAFENFFLSSNRRVAFVACSEGEVSHASHALKHSLWAHHVIEAFRGAAPAAAEKKRLLTTSSLHAYLETELPRAVRASMAGTATQTPVSYGGNFLLADLQPVLDQRKEAERFSVDQLMKVSLSNEKAMPIRSLSGFAKHHKIPTSVTAYAEHFVANLASSDIEDDLNAIFSKLKDVYRFGRKDLQTKRGDSGGSIITPFFDYDVTVTLNVADPSEVVWRRQVAHIRDPQKVIADAFDSVFKGVLDTLDFSTGKPVSVEAVIDQIEAIKEGDVAVRYDKDLQWCEIRIAHLPATIKATAAGFSISLTKSGSTKTLIQAFFELQKVFADQYSLKLLSLK
ncbi:MAG: hypothetical protein U0744_18535 [Gemmataceae bacterium]